MPPLQIINVVGILRGCWLVPREGAYSVVQSPMLSASVGIFDVTPWLLN